MLEQKSIETIKKIIEVFETGKVSSNYGVITILEDGAGISYGKSQATDKADTLDAIVFRYIDKQGMFANSLSKYVDELNADLTTTVDPKNPPAWVKDLMSILKTAGEKDPLMKAAQDEIFDQHYWKPAYDQGIAMRLVYPLSYAIVYDTCIHSGPGGVVKIRKLFPEYPPSNNGDEKIWAKAYVNARRKWLSSYPNAAVQKTVYRMDTFLSLIAQDNWKLDKSFKVLGQKIV